MWECWSNSKFYSLDLCGSDVAKVSAHLCYEFYICTDNYLLNVVMLLRGA